MGIRQIGTAKSAASSVPIQTYAPSVLGAKLVRGMGVLPKDILDENLEDALRLVLSDEQTLQMVSDAQVAAESGLLPQMLLQPLRDLRKLWEQQGAGPPDWQTLRLDSVQRAAAAQLTAPIGTNSDFWTPVLQFLRKIAAVTSALMAKPLHGPINTAVEDQST